MANIPMLNGLRFSRRSALDIFGMFEEDRLGYLGQIKMGRGYSDKVQKKHRAGRTKDVPLRNRLWIGKK